jgi:hypothetical protein
MGLITEDLETFLFDFKIRFRSYEYTTNVHKLNFFPSTLKEASLRWFMGLGANLIKYKEYCRGQDLKGDDILKMS